MEDQELDSAFKRMGTSAPFHVDWDEYAAKLIRRLSMTERRRRRQSWWLALAGTAFGAAAAWLVAVHTVTSGRNDKSTEAALPVQEQPAPTAIVPDAGRTPVLDSPAMVCVRRPGGSMVLRSMPGLRPEEIGPFVQRTVCEDGRVGEIRFYGFTPEGAEGESYIIVGEGGRPTSARPGMGL